MYVCAFVCVCSFYVSSLDCVCVSVNVCTFDVPSFSIRNSSLKNFCWRQNIFLIALLPALIIQKWV